MTGTWGLDGAGRKVLSRTASKLGLVQSGLAPRLQLWTPGMTDFKGGIQVYSGFVRAALMEILAPEQLQVLALHDRTQTQARSCPLQSSLPPTIGMGRWPRKLRPLVFALQAIALALLQPPQLILSTHLHLAVLARWLKVWFGIPYWVVAHGFEAWEIAKPAVREALLQADGVLAVSHYTRDRLLARYDLSPERVKLLPNTFDGSRFAIAPKPQFLLQRHGFDPTTPVILTVNRLAAGEDFHPYDQVLAALPQIRQVLPDVHYLIGGEGGDRPRLEQWIRELGLEDCVTLTGFIAEEELPHYYNLCDCFAMPSKLEGFGIVCLEALASGKPVLASQVDGGSHALLQGELGCLVNPDNIDEIAAGILRLLTQTSENPWLSQPEQLRARTLQAFGQPAFQQQLRHWLASEGWFQADGSPPHLAAVQEVQR